MRLSKLPAEAGFLLKVKMNVTYKKRLCKEIFITVNLTIYSILYSYLQVYVQGSA
jgi:hypothetical protein